MSENSLQSSPSSSSVISRKERRRLSQARHRDNVAESYRSLRELLPLKDATKVKSVRYNKTMLLQKAKEYVWHLEDILEDLLEQNEGSSDIKPIVNLDDVRNDFSQNYNLGRLIFEYEFANTPLFDDRDDLNEEERKKLISLFSFDRKRLLHHFPDVPRAADQSHFDDKPQCLSSEDLMSSDTSIDLGFESQESEIKIESDPKFYYF